MNKLAILWAALILLIGIIGIVIASQIEDKLFIKKGWNLIYGFTPSSLEGQSFDTSHIKAIYAFIPTTQEYARVYPRPENDKIDLIGDGYLADTSFWVYSDAEAEAKYSLQEPMPLGNIGEHKLYKRWNFFGITPAFIDRSLEEIKGSCNILKAYIWNAGSQEWINLPLTEKLDEGDEEIKFGGGNSLGLVLKVEEDCELGEILIVPALPDPERTGCFDSDGGLNHLVKGVVNDYWTGEILEDFCVDTTKLSEAICNAKQRGAYAQYNCPDGCYNGACIVPACVINNPFSCKQGNIKTQYISIDIGNWGSEAINIKNLSIKGCGSFSTATSLNVNEIKTLKVPCSLALVLGERFKGDIILDYTNINSNIVQRSVGFILNQVK